MTEIVDRIFKALAEQGHEMYGGEAVTQLQHALQCATLAEVSGAPSSLVAAALRHDYGHLINEDDAEAAAIGHDQHHEDVAADYLARWFPPSVTQPIRFHVPAKRYLCSVDKDYFASLSPASVRSLDVQGGPFTADEAAEFIALEYADDAVALRRWDDLAKDPAGETPPLEAFRPIVAEVLASR